MDRLQVEVGIASERGRREVNEDYCAVRASDNVRAVQEWIAVIADGLGGGPGGRLAAETTARGFFDAYLNLPETLGVDRAAGRALAAMNRWVYAQGRQDEKLRGMATTFSALILRGRGAHVVHVGDTRVYRLRDGQLQCLTEDHVHAHPDLRHVLYRAVGLEENTRADYSRHDLHAHDRYVLCSDGVHSALRLRQLTELLAERASPEEDARRLVERALAAGSQDNVTAAVLDVVSVPAAQQSDLALQTAALRVLELPKPGEVVDGFRLAEVLSDGRNSRLFRAEDTREQREVILKFPHPRALTEAAMRAAFVREAWIAQQVKSPYVADVLTPASGRQTRLYVVMPYYRGESLEARLKRAPQVGLAEGVDIGVKLGRAIYALNRLRIIHRDVKPENILLTADAGSGLKLLDLGVARLPGTEPEPSGEVPGTPSYMAPELFADQPGDEGSDVYAYGVTLYRMFSGGHYPYGEVEPFSTPRFSKRTPLGRARPDLPAWLDACLARATAVDARDRHGDAMELALELEHHLARGPATPPRREVSFYDRDPLRFWQIVSVLLLIALIVAMAMK